MDACPSQKALKGLEQRVRLWGVNAPEKYEQGYYASKLALETLVFNKEITYTDEGRDKYGRIVARVFIGKREVQRVMLEAGQVTELCHFSGEFYGQC